LYESGVGFHCSVGNEEFKCVPRCENYQCFRRRTNSVTRSLPGSYSRPAATACTADIKLLIEPHKSG